MKEEEVLKINVEPGEFPFPIIDGPVESRYLTWIRNNANYMAVRGFLDYMRAIGVLLRGIVINFVVLLPFALLVSFAIAWWYQSADPYVLTFAMLILATAVVLLYPLLTPLWNIFRHRRRLETGSDSSVKPRSRLEQLFGILLLTVLGVAAFESLAASLEPFHKLVYESDLNRKEFLSVMSVALAIFASTDKLLAALGGIARKIAMIAIGVLGVLVPLFFILLVSDYLVFNPPIWSIDIVIATLAIPAIMVLTIAIANLMLLIGWIRSLSSKRSHVFTFRDVNKIFLFFLMLLAVFCFIFEFWDNGDSKFVDFSTGVYSFPVDIKNINKEPSHHKDGETCEVSGWIRQILPHQNEKSEVSLPLDNKSALDEDLQKLFADAGKEPYPPKLRQLFNRLVKLPKTGNTIDPALYTELQHVKPLDRLDIYTAYSPQIERQVELIGTLPPEERKDQIKRLKRLVESVPLLRLLEPKDMSTLAKTVVDVRSDITEWEIERKKKIRPGWKTDPQSDPEDYLVTRFGPYLPLSSDDKLYELAEQTYEDLLQAYDKTTALELYEPVQAYDEATGLWTNLPDEQHYERWDHLFDDFDNAYTKLALRAIYWKIDYPRLFNASAAKKIRRQSFELNAILLLMFAVPLWLITRFTVDINLTSIHGLYRDRLASAFLVGADTKGDVDIEKDLDLGEICRHEAGSIAPYHLINVALNLQGSKSMGVRDRQSDFFVFSKKFIGGYRTGYCRGETMELFFPQMGLSTAMAISAAAASPNMGRATSPALVVIMTLFNIRLGYWLPNPSRLESWLHKRKGAGGKEGGYVFNDVFKEELIEVSRRWGQTYENPERYQSSEKQPTIAHSLVGVGFSGGGIRSATLNLGITQALHKNGVFKHIDYMSTVSGGGYLGSSISALMRQKTKTESETSGTVDVSQSDTGEVIVSVTPEKGIFSFLRKPREDRQPHIYQYADYATLAVEQGDRVRKGQRLLNPNEVVDAKNLSFSPYYRWRVRPSALLREIAGKLNEESKWVNVSDGGHIENLAGIELLRRRCKYIVIGDGEADPEHHFNGLAILIQTARIDLGIHIEINVDPLRLNKKGLSKAHWVAGRIHYPGEVEKGYLLYIKSSVTGDEDEVIKRYRNTQPAFPHESTADQFFGEGQFEAYRSLGQHIGESLFETVVKDDQPETAGQSSETGASDAESSNSHKKMSFAEFEQWFEMLASKQET